MQELRYFRNISFFCAMDTLSVGRQRGTITIGQIMDGDRKYHWRSVHVGVWPAMAITLAAIAPALMKRIPCFHAAPQDGLGPC
jgi:hypothetical protein